MKSFTPKIKLRKPIVAGVYTLHKPTECDQNLGGKSIHRKPEKVTEGKTVVKIVTNDSIREVIVPDRKPVDLPEILPASEINRLIDASHVLTTKDRMAMLDAATEQRAKLSKECEMRKEMLRSKTSHTKKTGKHLNEIELAEHKRTTHLLKRAVELQRENELEVQTANSLILATKCQAIRDAQIAEKELIKQEIINEEKRLQLVQEEEIAKQHKSEMKRREQERLKQMEYVHGVLQQIKEHEVKQLFEMEKKEEEARMQNRILLQMQREADEKHRKKLEEARRTHEETNQINKKVIEYHLIKKEEERIEDLRINEFLRKKAEREAAVAEEQRLIRETKNKARDRLYEIQERALNLQETGDEMRALRIQEEVERKWRANEKDAARQRVENAQKLIADRNNQIMDLKRMQALDMERDKIEHFKNINVNKEWQERELEAKRKRNEANQNYRKELLRQINQKEKERIEDKRHNFEDGMAQKLEQERKEQQLKNYIKDKVNTLREVNFVPENLIKDIERQLKI